MMYLIEPTGEIYRHEYSIGRALVRRDIENKSLDSLPWQPVETEFDVELLIGLAFAHGIATGRGIILDAGFYDIAQEPKRLAEAERRRAELDQELSPVTARGSGPGYAERASELNRWAREARLDVEEKKLKAQQNRDKVMEVEPKEALVNHWEALVTKMLAPDTMGTEELARYS